MHDDDVSSPILGRRQMLRASSALGLFALARVATGRADAAPLRATESVDFSDLVDDPRLAAVCTLTPSQTQGPYYLPLDLVRQDITEGTPGLPTRVHLQVVRSADCSPVPNAIVDLWHARANGNYSGFASEGTSGQTWLRGIQTTDANGSAWFDTVYPGWYQGRTIHMHLKVRPSAGTVLTTQLYFKQRLTNRVFTAIAPYSSYGLGNTTNSNDTIFTPATIMDVVSATPGLLQVALVIAIA